MSLKALRAALIGLALACADGAAPTRLEASCHSDRDCQAGQICYADGCGSAVDFAVRVTPNNSNFVVQDFNPVSVAMSQMDLAVLNPGIIEGDVKVRTATGIAPFADGFQIQATGRSSIIPGLAFGQPVIQNVAKNVSRYSLAVAPGIWDLRVTPTPPAALPTRESPATPVIPPVFVEKAVGSGDVIDPALVLAGDGLNEIQGRVVVAQGVPWPDDRPIFFRYQALDPVSLSPLSQPAVFLSSSTFHVFTATKSGPLMLRVSPDPKLNADAAIPTKDFLADEKTGAIGPFELGSWGEPVEVKGSVQDPSGAPIASADLRAEGRVKGGGSFAVTGKTDPDGRFSFKLLPSEPGEGAKAGKYTITVHPPYGSPYATAESSASVADAALELAPIVCPPKVVLSGRVLGPLSDGTTGPLANVPVYLEGNPGSATPGASVVRDLVTRADGTFSASVEPGGYQVIAAPSADLPWAAQVVVATASTEIPDLVLAAGRVVQGSLIYRNKDGTEKQIAGATITVYRQPTSTVITPMRLYEAVTDATGHFKVVLPKVSETPPNLPPPPAGADAGVPAGPDAGPFDPQALRMSACSQGGSPTTALAIVLASIAAALTIRRRRSDR